MISSSELWAKKVLFNRCIVNPLCEKKLAYPCCNFVPKAWPNKSLLVRRATPVKCKMWKEIFFFFFGRCQRRWTTLECANNPLTGTDYWDVMIMGNVHPRCVRISFMIGQNKNRGKKILLFFFLQWYKNQSECVRLENWCDYKKKGRGEKVTADMRGGQ